MIVIQVTWLTAVRLHPLWVLTLTLPVPPEAGKDALVGVMEYVQVPPGLSIKNCSGFTVPAFTAPYVVVVRMVLSSKCRCIGEPYGRNVPIVCPFATVLPTERWDAA